MLTIPNLVYKNDMEIVLLILLPSIYVLITNKYFPLFHKVILYVIQNTIVNKQIESVSSIENLKQRKS